MLVAIISVSTEKVRNAARIHPLRRIMTGKPIYSDPSDVDAAEGAVDVNGPDQVDVTMTPEAAEETSARLEAEAIRARGQRRLKGLPHQPKR